MRSSTTIMRAIWFAILTLSLYHFSAQAAENQPAYSIDNEKFRIRLIPRTPDQIASFYEGRGFPKDAIAYIRTRCFITVGIRNKSREPVWLELANWRFISKSGEFSRFDRRYWRQHWQQLGLALRFQSTFRWTLLPEILDFRFDEREGGNIVLPRGHGPFTITASFATGKHKRGGLIKVTFKNVRCAGDLPQ